MLDERCKLDRKTVIAADISEAQYNVEAKLKDEVKALYSTIDQKTGSVRHDLNIKIEKEADTI